MTTDSSAVERIAPLRLPIALVLLLVNLFWLLISVERFLVPRDAVNEFDRPPGFADRGWESFPQFVGLLPLLLPLVAVLLVTLTRPAVPVEKLVVTVALGEYAASALFGLVAFLSGFFADGNTLRGAVEDGFARIGWFALLGVVGAVVVRIAQPMYQGPPKPDRFAAYGRGTASAGFDAGGFAAGSAPAGASPGGYAAQQPATPYYGQPASAPPASALPYGQPSSAPPYAHPASAPPHTPPSSAPPYAQPGSAQQYGQPGGAQPSSAPPFPHAAPYGQTTQRQTQRPASAPPYSAPSGQSPSQHQAPGPAEYRRAADHQPTVYQPSAEHGASAQQAAAYPDMPDDEQRTRMLPPDPR